MNNTTQYNDSTHNGNNIFVTESTKHPLEVAIQAMIDKSVDNHELIDIIEELAEYTTARPNREIIGVENKLKNGGRTDLIDEAVRLKNKFERLVAKGQMSLFEQKKYVHILSAINTIFNQKIRPLILEKKSKSDIDAVVLEQLISPIYQSIVKFDDAVTMEVVAGMLYYLTGKCHLHWSEK